MSVGPPLLTQLVELELLFFGWVLEEGLVEVLRFTSVKASP